MRPILIGLCLLAAACSSQRLDSPTSPTSTGVGSPASTGLGLAQTPAQSGAELPFKGTIAGTTSAVVTPPTIEIDSVGGGVATHLGRFTARSANFGLLGVLASTGTWDFTAANGDELFTTISSTVEPLGPASGVVTSIATIVRGTGRFARATGTFTVRFTEVHDEVTATGEFSGSFEGHINLK
jgi:hypothetical protein